MTIDDRTEWLEPDGLGGFASGTTSAIRTRRYHALLLAATTPPTGRIVLVNGFDAWIETSAGRFALSTQRYTPDVLHPDGASRIVSFAVEPWPTWEFELPDGTRVRHEISVQHGSPVTVVTWQVVGPTTMATLYVRPFLSGRDYHSTHHENSAFRFDAEVRGAAARFEPYPGLPAVTSLANAEYRHAPLWYRHFTYVAERDRGLDDVEDLASPGELRWTLDGSTQQAVWILGVEEGPLREHTGDEVRTIADHVRSVERSRRLAFPTPLDRAADAYIVQRRSGRTIVAGYPWFTDWGRDTFIALRGLCLATGRLAEARDILVEWAGAVSEGMLPNRFPDRGEAAEFNSVDASLWYVIACDELLQLAAESVDLLSPRQRDALERAIWQIVQGYAAGTRFGIRLDNDALLAAGAPGVQLTWMDARVGDRVITPRVGKPVEVQALWLNAVVAAARLDSRWREVFDRGRAAFVDRFWNERDGFLADVVDVDHQRGTRDNTFRPNQILAVGGLPTRLLAGPQAKRVVDAVEQQLLTPLGLRSLAPNETGYSPRYEGGPSTRDAVYHQGTVWPWLIGPFVDAWIRVRGGTPAARREARRRFLTPLLEHLGSAGLGHVSEIIDAESPFTPRGCPFQAWSLGELIRLDRQILRPARRKSSRRTLQPA